MLHCKCAEWKRNVNLGTNDFVILHIHGLTIHGDIYKICPWCGKKLNKQMIPSVPKTIRRILFNLFPKGL